jgi:hypothetical protein
MSNLLFNNEVNQLKKMGVNEDTAILVASSKLEDKTLFNLCFQKMKEENDLIANQIEMLGFKKSTDNIIEDEPSSTEKVKDI